MNDHEKAIYEAQWSSKHERLIQWHRVIRRLKNECKQANKLSPEDSEKHYNHFRSKVADRFFDSIAGTIYCPKRDKYIDHFEYIALH